MAFVLIFFCRVSLFLLLPCFTLADLDLGLENIPTINAADLPVDGNGANYSDPQVVGRILETWAEDHPAVPDSFMSSCPASCSELGHDPSHWYLYPGMERLASCDKPLLLDFAIHSDVDDTSTLTAIRACTSDHEASPSVMRRPVAHVAKCTIVNGRQVDSPTHLGLSGPLVDGAATDRIASIIGQIGRQLDQNEKSCTQNFATFATDGKVAMGLYAGSQIVQQDLVPRFLSILSDYVLQKSATESMTLEVCDPDTVGADYFLGLAVSTSGDVGFVQRSVKTWTSGRCLGASSEQIELLGKLPLNIPAAVESSTSDSLTARSLGAMFRLGARATCKTTKVNRGDGCWAVAQRCGITEAELKKFNTRSNFCNTLAVDEVVCCSSGTLPDTTLAPNADGSCKTTRVEAQDLCGKLAAKCGTSYADLIKINPAKDFCNKLVVGQHVCCGRGKLPDYAPKPNTDGTCSAYTVKKDDNCSIIAASHSLTIEKLESFNKKTWGWNGCNVPLWVGVRLCLSTGAPPMPAPVENAVCGPTVPGTKKPAADVDLATLNPCLLKTCCNIWGQCGTTDDFCTESKSETGAPGTSKPGTHGCISNCGQHIVYTIRTAKPMRVAYFSAWNWKRPCLNMAISQIDTSYYTHVHYAFADITPDTFEVDVSRYQYQFDQFKAMKGVKRIISFGGWEFSTAPATYRILRQATRIENRQKFAANVLAFVNKHGLDGVDLDWEYPGAPDIPGIPQGDPAEGANYFATMYMLKNAMGSSKSMSFAAPASYWYLKAFPIAIMGQWLDYIIYMTYDLHGQWDAGNPWTMDGCPGGNCLRSHVNMTLTLNALSMVTKAGVPSNKVVVGVTSYGRSFRMNSASCSGSMCTFGGTRDSSPATKGRCTGTGGYIANAEIDEIINSGKATRSYFDDESKSDILIYNKVDWVAYMTDKTKTQREALYGLLQFAGITDWAVDLQKFDVATSGPDTDWEPPAELTPCADSYAKVSDIVSQGNKVPSHCVEQYVIGALSEELGDSLNRYDTLMRRDYDTKFGYFNKAVKKSFEVSLKDLYDNRHPELFNCFQQRDDGRNSDGTWRWKNYTVECPPQTMPAKAYNIYLVPKNQGQLSKLVEDEYGISWEWIQTGRMEFAPCIPDHSGSFSCDDIGKLVGHLELRRDFRMPDPKDAVRESIGNVKDIRRFLEATLVDFELGQEGGFGADFIDATALPVYMIEASIEAMEKVYEIGEEAQKKEMEMIILLVLTGFLFILPGVGAALSSITGIASLARLSVIAAEAGGAGLGVYDVATNPDSSPLSIFAVLIAGLASLPVRGTGFVSKGAAARRGMSAKEVADMGDTVKKGLDNVSTLVRMCRR